MILPPRKLAVGAASGRVRIAALAWLAVVGASSAAFAGGLPGGDSIVRVNRETGGFCTGFAVDERTVVTAAHCLWLARPMNWIRPTSLHILAGYDRGAYRQHLRVVEFRIGADFEPKGRAGQSGDWALLKLDKPFAGPVLPFARRPAAVGDRFSAIGFAITRRHRLTGMADCRVRAVSSAAFVHSCPAGRGHSGGPMVGREDGRLVAFGVHVASGRDGGLAIAAGAISGGRARRPD